jgi:hypothetical protein
MTNDQIRRHFGELNAAEMRLARAIVGWHERQIEELKAEAAKWKANHVADTTFATKK